MTGNEIRTMILNQGFKLWEVADKMGCSDSTFSRKLRKRFDNAQVDEVKAAIVELLAERAKRTR